jgi:hypothetical protein
MDDNKTFLCYYCPEVDTCARAYEREAEQVCVEIDAIANANSKAEHAYRVQRSEYESDRRAWAQSDRLSQ